MLKIKTGLYLSQRKYCLELLHEFGLLARRPVMTPLGENVVLPHKESEGDKYLHMHLLLKFHVDTALRLLKLAPGNVTKTSVSGYCVFVNACSIPWKSEKQATLSRSLAKAEYSDHDNILKREGFTWFEYAWRWIYKSCGLVGQKVKNHGYPKTKHFDIDVHLVREKVSSGLIRIVKVDSEENVVDILTKALGSFSMGFY
ncbi:hypothetical protein Tco_0511058 [Tanacetum coccineum]